MLGGKKRLKNIAEAPPARDYPQLCSYIDNLVRKWSNGSIVLGYLHFSSDI